MGRMACTEPQYLYKGALYLTLFIGYCEKLALTGLSHLIHRILQLNVIPSDYIMTAD